MLTIMNRKQMHSILLNNYDIVLISSDIKGENKYVGVSKHHGISEFSECKGQSNKLNQLHVELYQQYYGLENCSVDYFSVRQKECYLVNCLWQVQKLNEQSTDCPFLVRAKEGVVIRHM